MSGEERDGTGGYVFEVDAFELRHHGVRVALEPQVLEVLAYFLDHPRRLVRKEELLDNIWGDRFVSESALTSRIRSVRRALGDDGKAQRTIQTVHGRGYRYVGDVEVRRSAPPESPDAVEQQSQAGVHHNLPAPRTPLVGRAEELGKVSALVRTNRLVSLVGIGGSGKTRLAIEVARELVGDFADGVWFVDLVPRRPSDPLDVAVADAAGISLAAGSGAQTLTEVIGHRRLLLMLDNCEHVLAAVADVVDHLLDSTDCHVLLTSRLPLNLAGEYRCPIGSLSVEGSDAAAVEFFLATAGRFGADMEALDRGLVEHVCRRLDGLPLALELAAAHLRHLPLVEISARLERRFELLVSTRKDPRHPSLAAVLDDTWEGLAESEKSLLVALAAFPGDFGLADVEEMLGRGDVLSPLGELVDRSLVAVRSGPAARYHLLDSVRAFAQAEAGPDAVARAREGHAHWCASRIGDDVRTHIYDYRHAWWCQEHHDDLLAAEAHFIDTGRVGEGATITAGASFAWHIDVGARAAGALRRIDTLLGAVDDEALRCRLHMAAVYAGMASRSPDRIAAHGRSALDTARTIGSPELLCPALVLASWSTVFEDGDAALAMAGEASHLAQQADDLLGWVFAESYRCWYLAVLRREEEALEVAEAAVQRVGEDLSYPAASALNAVASLLVLDDPTRAAHALFDHPAHPTEVDMWGQDLLAACVIASGGHLADARRRLFAVHDRLRRAGVDGFPDLLVPCSVIALERNDVETARRWADAVRRSARPTQSFQVTIVYRQVRRRVGPSATSAGPQESLEEVGAAALRWLSDLAL